MIKKLLVGVLIVLFLAISPALSQGTVQKEVRTKEYVSTIASVDLDGYIVYVEGDVFFEDSEKPAAVDMDILQRDVLITKRGCAEVYLAGNLLGLDRDTRVEFISDGEIMLWTGQIYVQVNFGEIRVTTPYQEYILRDGFYRIRANEARYFNDPYYYYDWSWRWHRFWHRPYYGFRYHPWYPSWVYPRYSPKYYSPRTRERTIIHKKQLQAPFRPRILRPRDSTSRPAISRRPNQQQPNRSTPPQKKIRKKD